MPTDPETSAHSQTKGNGEGRPTVALVLPAFVADQVFGDEDLARLRDAADVAGPFAPEALGRSAADRRIRDRRGRRSDQKRIGPSSITVLTIMMNAVTSRKKPWRIICPIGTWPEL